MKLLWIKPGGFLPLDSGGRIRSFHLAKELARYHEVSLFVYYPTQDPDPHHDLGEPFRGVECHPLAIPYGRGWREAIAFLGNWFSRLPYSVAKYSPPEMAKALKANISDAEYDLLLCDFIFPAAILPWSMGIPTVLFTHNVEANIWERHARVAENPIWRAMLRREGAKMREIETYYLRKSDHILTVSMEDAETFGTVLRDKPITVVPTGVDINFFRFCEREEPYSIVFTGSMDWMPNEDGVLWFYDKVFPEIRSQYPESVLWVVGRRPTAKLRDHIGGDPGVRITGTVDDIRPYIEKAAVYIVPLRIGSGTRVKIFEAMASGKPVVATSIGAEGLPVSDGHNILVADSPAEIASCVSKLFASDKLRAKIGAEGRRLVEDNHSWAGIGRYLSNLLTEVVGSNGS